MGLQTLPGVARGYVRTVIGLGAVIMGATAAMAPPPLTPALLVTALAAAALASHKLMLVGRPGKPGSRTHQMSTLSLGFPVVLGALLAHGAVGGMVTAIASAVGACLYPRRHPLYRLCFNSVSLGLSTLVAGLLMQRLDTTGGDAVPPLALLAGTLAYFLLNTGMVALAVALSQRERAFQTWQHHYLWTAPSYLAGAAVVDGAFFLQSRYGNAVAAMSLLCLYLIYYSYKSYLQQVHQLQANEQRLQEVCLATVESLALAIEAKDSGTHSHARRVQQIAVALAMEVGVTPDELEAIRVASLTHDVGKLAVPDTILSKAGRLTKDEFERVKLHVEIGATILEPVKFPWPVLEIVRSHHERWDGQGYPAGLEGEEIPLGGRIVALADVFDALTSPRPYRQALDPEQAHAIIHSGSGTQFDPRLVARFDAIFPLLVALLVTESEHEKESDGDARATGQRSLLRVWDQIRGASREARMVAFTDPLTGLANKRHLESALPRELETAQAQCGPLSVLMIDLDGFKAINDTHGHLMGDAVLQIVARILGEAVREDAVVCRYAGDEFVIVLPATTREKAEHVAQRLRSRVDACVVPGTELRVGLSIGAACYPEDGASAKELLDTADSRMYSDKSSHKAGRLAVVR